ncbi:MAG TPA: Lsr2 family protein [Actinocrinis sp.]|nr:Lsr2 family protein [Actinocrinis sp.]
MAQQVVVTLVDDLDGTPADEVVRFGLNGVQHEIDLSTANAEKFRAMLAPYIAAARRDTPAKAAAGKAARKDAAPTVNTSEVREWAKSAGIEISDRGRIASDVLVKFQAAHV